jgi:hypothetical protein
MGWTTDFLLRNHQPVQSTWVQCRHHPDCIIDHIGSGDNLLYSVIGSGFVPVLIFDVDRLLATRPVMVANILGTPPKADPAKRSVCSLDRVSSFSLKSLGNSLPTG